MCNISYVCMFVYTPYVTILTLSRVPYIRKIDLSSAFLVLVTKRKSIKVSKKKKTEIKMVFYFINLLLVILWLHTSNDVTCDDQGNKPTPCHYSTLYKNLFRSLYCCDVNQFRNETTAHYSTSVSCRANQLSAHIR